MAIQYQTVEWIIAGVERHSRKVARHQEPNRVVLALTLSFGTKELTPDGTIATDPHTGAHLWQTLADRTFEARVQDVLDFAAQYDPRGLIAELQLETEAYRQVLPAERCNFFLLDALTAAPMEALAQWMLSTGRWRI